MKWQPITMLATAIIAAVITTAAVAKEPHKKVATPSASLPKFTYEVVKEFQVGGAGDWGSTALDAAGKYLYIPRGTQTQVVDTATGKVTEIASHSAASVALVPDANRGFITNFKDGTVAVFDLKTNAVLGNVAVGASPSRMIYDPASKRLLVQCGDSSLVPLNPDIDLKTGKPDPAITFEGHILGLVADEQGMVYLSMIQNDGAHDVTVLDTRTMTIATQWPFGHWQSASEISMDRLHGRLFLFHDANMMILSASDGHVIDDIQVGPRAPWGFAGSTMAYYDGHVLVACGDGSFVIVGQKPDGDYVVEDTIKDTPNSHPIALDPKTGKVYLPSGRIEKWQVVPESFKVEVLQKK